MGTNYYAIQKLDESSKLKIIEAVINNQVDAIRKLAPKQIHLGKSSAGYPFLFNHNNWEYYESAQELLKIIDNYEITDEYGRKLSAEGFKELIEATKEYMNENYTKPAFSAYCIMKDGYVFSISTNFT